MFPSNFVEMISVTEAPTTSVVAVSTSSSSSSTAATAGKRLNKDLLKAETKGGPAAGMTPVQAVNTSIIVENKNKKNENLKGRTLNSLPYQFLKKLKEFGNFMTDCRFTEQYFGIAGKKSLIF